MKILLCLASLLLLATGLRAQQEKITPKFVPLPDGPLLRRAPNRCEWTITYTYPKPDATNAARHMPPHPVKSVITKTDLFYHDITSDDAEKKLERWTDGQLEIIESSEQPTPTIEYLNAYDWRLVNYSKNEFPDLEWVSKDNYVGVIKHNDQDYLVFRESATGQTAYIKASTRLPWRLQRRDATLDYTFAETALTSQQFPEDARRIMDHQIAVSQKLGHYGERP